MRLQSLISYDPRDPHQTEEFRAMLDGPRWKRVVWDIFEDVLRPTIKHGQDEVKVEHYEKIRDEIIQLLNDYDLSLR